MATLRIRLLAATVILLFAGPAVSGRVAGEQPAIEAAGANSTELGASFIQGLIANNRAVSNYDVSITYSKSYFRPDGLIFSSDIAERRLWSKQGNRHLYVRDSVREMTGRDLMGSVHGAAFSDSNDFVVFDAAGKRRQHSHSVERTRYYTGWSTFETIGLAGYPHVAPATSAHSSWETLALAATGAFVGNDLIEVKLSAGGLERDMVRQVWLFDVHKLVPRSRVVHVLPRDGEPYIKEREQYTFKQFNQIFLPVSIIRDVVEVHVDADTGTRTPYEHMSEIKFDWHRVNEEMGDKEFTADRFEGLQQMKEFLRSGSPLDGP